MNNDMPILCEIYLLWKIEILFDGIILEDDVWMKLKIISTFIYLIIVIIENLSTEQTKVFIFDNRTKIPADLENILLFFRTHHCFLQL